MNKLLLASGTLMLPLISGQAQKQDSPSKTPNVVFIMADDLGIDDLGYYGQDRIKTPATDALVTQGMKFTQHYSGSTVSAPSRCVLLTGRYTGHSYIRGNKGYKTEDGRSYDLNLADEEITIGEMFKTKNYVTACVGRWGLEGPFAEGYPDKQGFDYFFGYLGQGNVHNYYPVQLFENSTPVMLNHKVYSHDMIMDKTLEFIDKNADKLFFVYLTPIIPHVDIIVPNNEPFDYDGKFEEVPYLGKGYRLQEKPRTTFATMVTQLGRDIQRIIDLSVDKGVFDNTIIIFTSDNGTHKEGGHDPGYFDSNGPSRGMKRDLHEGGICTPFTVKWSEVIPARSVSFQVSVSWNLIPTMCELIGAPTPANIDSPSYLPALAGKGKQRRHDYLYLEPRGQGGEQAVIKDGQKLLHSQVNNPRKEHYELYNLNADPRGDANVLNQYPQKVQELEKIMKKVRTTNENRKSAFEK